MTLKSWVTPMAFWKTRTVLSFRKSACENSH